MTEPPGALRIESWVALCGCGNAWDPEPRQNLGQVESAVGRLPSPCPGGELSS